MKGSKPHRRLKRGLTVIVLGPQGSGKGTQAALLAERHGFVHLEAGGMLRAAARRTSQTAWTRRLARDLASGRLVPFTWVLRLVEERLRTIGKQRGVVIDGTPRRMPEARRLLTLLARFGRTPDHVFALSLSRAESVRRLSKRWVCRNCHRTLTMGVDIRSPKSACPRCGGEIYQRDDDRPEAIAKRLAIFQRETRPVVEYFRKRGLVRPIRGEQTIRRVYSDVDRVLHHQ
ncbi:MAG: nucleoside monophosphate kinase [Candidatus Kerfeldbacteria bacterium]|nr:nucleoside monophosphate kinase [Candidatus Kerfeldbacteria bacterium]